MKKNCLSIRYRCKSSGLLLGGALKIKVGLAGSTLQFTAAFNYKN